MTQVTLPADRTPVQIDDAKLLQVGTSVLREEASELIRAADRMGESLCKAARLVAGCRGRLVVSGMGKSGHVGRKISATLASLGTPSFFVHAAEAAHGDLGMVRQEDAALLISHSGKTAEVVSLAPFFKRLGAPVIAITGDLSSPLAAASDLVLDASVLREADPLNLAPTSSTTLQLAIGDALSSMVTVLRDLKREDFALFHPAGSLGKQLLLRVCDVMGTGDRLPLVRAETTVQSSIFEMTSKGYGATIVVDDQGRLLGIFTDGDLRRLLTKSGIEALNLPVSQVMTHSPLTISGDQLAVQAVRLMEQKEVSVLIVTRGEFPVGIIHLHELLQSGVA